MTIITAALMTVTLVLIVTTVPRLYHAFLQIETLCAEAEHELLRELLTQRNNWALRHLGCGMAALFLLWMAKTCPNLGIPITLGTSLVIYASSSLALAFLESLLAQKISGFLGAVSEPAKVQDQE